MRPVISKRINAFSLKGEFSRQGVGNDRADSTQPANPMLPSSSAFLLG
jgi:hypothetical protein